MRTIYSAHTVVLDPSRLYMDIVHIFWDLTISNPTRGAQLSMFTAHLHFVLSAMRDERLITISVCGTAPNEHARLYRV